MDRSIFWLLDQHRESDESLAELQATALGHARLADRLGFTGLWLAEHHFQTLGTAANPAVMLAAIAQCTQRLRLGPAVAVLPLRNPIHVAEDYALVDVLSGGRLDMGVGSGSRPLEFEGFGADFEGRREIFDANLAELRRRWSSAATEVGTRHSLNVAPLQRPAPPIYIATMSEEGAHAIGLAGDCMLTLVSPMTSGLDEIEARLAAHSRGIEEAGHARTAARAIVVAFAHIAESEEEARRVTAPALGLLIEAMVGTRSDQPEQLYDLMRERSTGLFGDTDHVARQLDQYAAIGAEHIAFVTRFGGMNALAAERSLRRLAPGRPIGAGQCDAPQ